VPVKKVRDIEERPVLHHVTLKTVRLEEMNAWYRAAVGCVPNFQFPGGSWTTNDAANHRVAFLQTPALSDDPEKLRHTGMHHMAFEFTTLDALLANYARLAEAGILPHACLDHGLTTSFYYQDPDGNSVELQADNFGNWNLSSEWMRTSEEFVKNPIGVEIDPPKMIAARQSGMSCAELLKRTYAGEFTPAVRGDIRLPM
jgi:catechol-2,3-dioxygenase